MIYHYSNTPDKVVKWTPQKFLDTFQAIYTGDQGLFFGTIPGSDLLLDVEPTGASVTNGIPFRLEKRTGNGLPRRCPAPTRLNSWSAARSTNRHRDFMESTFL